jgi:hypothetical protein
MQCNHTLRHRTALRLATLSLGALLALGAGAVRADDPYPPLDAEAQRVVDEAREQMRAIDRQRQAEAAQHLARTDSGGNTTDIPVDMPRGQPDQEYDD